MRCAMRTAGERARQGPCCAGRESDRTEADASVGAVLEDERLLAVERMPRSGAVGERDPIRFVDDRHDLDGLDDAKPEHSDRDLEPITGGDRPAGVDVEAASRLDPPAQQVGRRTMPEVVAVSDDACARGAAISGWSGLRPAA